jgi:hypothetical protein
MKKLVLLIGILTFSFGLSAQTIVSGNITGVWQPDGNPYIVVGNINIVNLLLIEPGVVVKFQAGGWMIQCSTGSKLIANGDIDNPIFFEPYQGNEPGLWNTIYFNGSGNDDTLKYCKIRGATKGIVILSSNTVIIGCEIFDNVEGIYIEIVGYETAFANILNCSLFNNSIGVRLAGWYMAASHANITNTIIAFNSTNGVANSYGGGIVAQDIIYSCFWGNGANFAGFTIPGGFGSNGNYQNYNGDSCDVNFNIYNDPMFVDTVNNNFNLQPSSKCIDAGTNLILGQFTNDPDGTMPDMGANYYPHTNAAILTYSFPQQTGPAEIDPVNKEITIEVINGTPLTNLVADFNLAGGATAKVNSVVQISGVTANDFIYPVTYVVTSDGGTNVQNWLVTVNVSTGINEIGKDYVLVYPNPFSDKTTIFIDGQNQRDYTLSIFDLSGKEVHHVNHIQSSSFVMERGSLPNGVYLIELKGEKVYRGKMVIK